MGGKTASINGRRVLILSAEVYKQFEEKRFETEKPITTLSGCIAKAMICAGLKTEAREFNAKVWDYSVNQSGGVDEGFMAILAEYIIIE